MSTATKDVDRDKGCRPRQTMSASANDVDRGKRLMSRLTAANDVDRGKRLMSRLTAANDDDRG
jgi:hypothetical protein